MRPWRAGDGKCSPARCTAPVRGLGSPMDRRLESHRVASTGATQAIPADNQVVAFAQHRRRVTVDTDDAPGCIEGDDAEPQPVKSPLGGRDPAP